MNKKELIRRKDLAYSKLEWHRLGLLKVVASTSAGPHPSSNAKRVVGLASDLLHLARQYEEARGEYLRHMRAPRPEAAT